MSTIYSWHQLLGRSHIALKITITSRRAESLQILGSARQRWPMIRIEPQSGVLLIRWITDWYNTGVEHISGRLWLLYEYLFSGYCSIIHTFKCQKRDYDSNEFLYLDDYYKNQADEDSGSISESWEIMASPEEAQIKLAYYYRAKLKHIIRASKIQLERNDFYNISA